MKTYRVKKEHREHFSLLIKTLKPEGMVIEDHDIKELKLLREAGCMHWLEEIKQKERVRGWVNYYDDGQLGGSRIYGTRKQASLSQVEGCLGQIYIDSEIETE